MLPIFFLRRFFRPFDFQNFIIKTRGNAAQFFPRPFLGHSTSRYVWSKQGELLPIFSSSKRGNAAQFFTVVFFVIKTGGNAAHFFQDYFLAIWLQDTCDQAGGIATHFSSSKHGKGCPIFTVVFWSSNRGKCCPFFSRIFGNFRPFDFQDFIIKKGKCCPIFSKSIWGNAAHFFQEDVSAMIRHSEILRILSSKQGKTLPDFHPFDSKILVTKAGGKCCPFLLFILKTGGNSISLWTLILNLKVLGKLGGVCPCFDDEIL